MDLKPEGKLETNVRNKAEKDESKLKGKAQGSGKGTVQVTEAGVRCSDLYGTIFWNVRSRGTNVRTKPRGIDSQRRRETNVRRANVRLQTFGSG